MLDLRKVVADPDAVKAAVKKRHNSDLASKVDHILALDTVRKERIQEVEALKQERNTASQEVASKKKAKEDASDLIEKMKEVSQRIKLLDDEVGKIQSDLKETLSVFPNLLHESVPEGEGENDNPLYREWGAKRDFSFSPKAHFEIGEEQDILDFKKAGEVTGARFVFLKGLAARLERSLIQFMMDVHSSRGYQEIIPPFMINRDSLYGTGQLSKFLEDVFKVEGHEFFLAPTAEVPVTNYHRGDILKESDLPKQFVAYSPCFRAEAGSYGKDTKGLKRQHQFDKVELVKFAKPEESYEALEGMLSDAEKILQLLELPYRVVTLCSGDIGFAAAKTYDIEVWSPHTQSYMEISSCSNMEAFQARRANIRYRSETDKKVHFVHTLNGSGLAVGRTLLAIMENYQKEDGTIEIPKVLQPYLEPKSF